MRRHIFLLFSALTLSCESFAEESKSSDDDGMFVQLLFGGSTPKNIQEDAKLASFGLYIGGNASKYFSIDIGASFSSNMTIEWKNPPQGADQLFIRKESYANDYSAGANLYLPFKQFAPYVRASFGKGSIASDTVQATWVGTSSIGGGVRMGRKVSFVLEYLRTTYEKERTYGKPVNEMFRFGFRVN